MWIEIAGWSNRALGVEQGDRLVNLDQVSTIEKLNPIGKRDQFGIRLTLCGDLQGECIEQYYDDKQTRNIAWELFQRRTVFRRTVDVTAGRAS